MMPITQMPENYASQLQAVYFQSRVPPGGGTAGGGKRPSGKPASKPSKKTGAKKSSKKR